MVMQLLCRLRGPLFSVILSLCVLTSTGEVFSSVSKMKTLPKLEKKLLNRFEDFLRSVPEDDLTKEMSGKVQKLQKSSRHAIENPGLIENPLHAFRLVRRMVKQWSAILAMPAHIVTASGTKLTEFLNSTRYWINSQPLWPSSIDLSGAAMAIVRLHHLYNLDYSSMLQGRFLNMTSQPMTSVELAHVTRAALKLGFICDAKELFSALETDSERTKTSRIVERLREKVANLVIGSTSECDHNSTFTIPSFKSLASASKQNRREAVRSLYHQICRKSMQEAILYGSGKLCYWHHVHLPYLRFKADLVNHDPFIVVFHDVISDKEIRAMKELSFAMIAPSTLADAQVAHEQHLVRVSQNAWLFDSSPIVSHMSQRVQLITGLSTRILREDTHAEPYQVLNYGLGGVYGPHEDSVRVPRHRGKENTPQLRNSGDRTATWMYYLSDVPMGGATVFPLLGVGVRPQKGTAVFWYNLKRSGQGDVRMVHAGCPVLYGDKWVANKWLREAGNVFTRPCLLEPSL